MNWTYHKGTDWYNDNEEVWYVWDTMGCQINVSTPEEAKNLCHYLNKNQVNGKFDDIDKAYEDWKNEQLYGQPKCVDNRVC
jgi:hypothetical protein